MSRCAASRARVLCALLSMGAVSACSSSATVSVQGSGGMIGSGGTGSGGTPAGTGGGAPGAGGTIAGSGGSGSGGALPGDAGDAGAADGGGETSPSGTGGWMPNVSGDGDGVRMIGPNYTRDPLTNAPPAGTPRGRLINFTMSSADSQIYKGVNGPYARAVSVYLPMQYAAGTAAPFIVTQDAMGQDVLPNALDNLIAMTKMPPMVVLFVNNGGGDAMGSERGLEYDTVSGLFAAFASKEVVPRAIAEVKKQLGVDLTLTDDPDGRGTFGGSSGGAASFSMAWWHPDLFRRAITFSGTFVSQVPANSPFPHGCWIYHDVDPHFADVNDAPKGLIVQHCEPATGDQGSDNPGPCDTPLAQAACEAAGCVWNTKANKPVRVWLESADGDLGTPGHLLDPKYGPVEYRDFNLANIRMAASFSARGYHYHYDHALNAGHVDGRVVQQTVVEALLWTWRGYPGVN